MPSVKNYTVILRRPDYVTTDPDDAIYIDYPVAISATKAVAAARRQAWTEDNDGEGPEKELADYALVFVCEGAMTNLAYRVK